MVAPSGFIDPQCFGVEFALDSGVSIEVPTDDAEARRGLAAQMQP
ncbi:MAG: hypothetical protein ABI440_10475 [Casimicrobiaceae bacterium]